MILRCYISFSKAITSSDDKGTCYNSSNEQDEVLNDSILKSLKSLTTKQEDKNLHYRVENQVRSQI